MKQGRTGISKWFLLRVVPDIRSLIAKDHNILNNDLVTCFVSAFNNLLR